MNSLIRSCSYKNSKFRIMPNCLRPNIIQSHFIFIVNIMIKANKTFAENYKIYQSSVKFISDCRTNAISNFVCLKENALKLSIQKISYYKRALYFLLFWYSIWKIFLLKLINLLLNFWSYLKHILLTKSF